MPIVCCGGFAIGNTGPSEEIEALAGESFDWLANLGAPAALVAGAVIATMIDQADFLKTTKKDTKLWARFTKRAAHILLISAFALKLINILFLLYSQITVDVFLLDWER